MEPLALAFMYVLYVALSYLISRRLIVVKGILWLMIGIFCYVGLTWLYFDAFFRFFSWLKVRGVSLDFGHAEESLIIVTFFEFLTGGAFIIYMIVVRIKNRRHTGI
jgi:hypothetical protein